MYFYCASLLEGLPRQLHAPLQQPCLSASKRPKTWGSRCFRSGTLHRCGRQQRPRSARAGTTPCRCSGTARPAPQRNDGHPMLERLVQSIRREQHQIFRPVVRRVVVDVVHTLHPRQRTTNRQRHHAAVLHHIAVRPSHFQQRSGAAHILDRLVRIRTFPIPVRQAALP